MKFRDKIPQKSPVIFAINHQNALMDALSLVFTIRGQIVFMARADIFRKKIIASILYFLKILPAYRIRDGFHSVDQNKEIFREVVSAIENNRPAAILPEGNHYGEKRLRPLKKGAARLALLTEEANEFNLGLHIVPVGLDYSNYYHAGSTLLVVFGDPIPIATYREQYLQNPTLAINSLTNDLAVAMKKVMIDIEPEEHYQTIKSAIDLYGPVELKRQRLPATLWNEFNVKKQLSEKIKESAGENETALHDLKSRMEGYRGKLAKFGLSDRQFAHKAPGFFSLFMATVVSLLLLPVHLYGMILNYLPYGLPVYLARNIKDPHFISSVRFVLGMLFFFFWYLILIILSFIIFDPVWLSLGFIISLPVTGLFAFYFYRNLLKMRGEFRALRLKIKDREAFDALAADRKELIGKIREMA